MPVISALWSESVLSEVLVFLLIGPRLIRLLAPGGAIALAAVAGVIRWTVAAFTTSPVILAFVQPLHGFTFALLHLAAMQVIVRVVPLRLAATAQAIYGTLCIGLATALLTLASGLLYGRMGGTAFLVMAALCLLALPLCARLRLPLPSDPAMLIRRLSRSVCHSERASRRSLAHILIPADVMSTGNYWDSPSMRPNAALV